MALTSIRMYIDNWAEHDIGVTLCNLALPRRIPEPSYLRDMLQNFIQGIIQKCVMDMVSRVYGLAATCIVA